MNTLRIPMSDPAPERPARGGLFGRLRRVVDAADAAWLEQARRRMRNTPGFIESLSPEVLARALQMEEPAASGGPAPKRSDL